MRVAIAGAGNVGRSIAAELVENGHEVLLIDKDPHAIKSETLADVEWLWRMPASCPRLKKRVSTPVMWPSRPPVTTR